jgi:hypothetical protein
MAKRKPVTPAKPMQHTPEAIEVVKKLMEGVVMPQAIPPLPSQVPAKPASIYTANLLISPLAHVSTADLLTEISNRSMAFMVVMLGTDKKGREKWDFAINGSGYVVPSLIQAAVNEGQNYMHKKMR